MNDVFTSAEGETPRVEARSTPSESPKGLQIEPYFVAANESPPDLVGPWGLRTARIDGEDGEPIFLQERVRAPESWSDLAVNVVASKYFRGRLDTPERESSVHDLVDRITRTIAKWGAEDGYFDGEASKSAFRNDLAFLLLSQRVAFNSPVYFNVGVDEEPQCSGCFINSVDDSMDSIMGLASVEGRIFKHGSGAGVNLSNLRGSEEPLNGGGTASGPVSFMRGYDAFAGVIKSGGKTRRAAKIAILDVNHPDILDFIRCKSTEERKARLLAEAGWGEGLDGDASVCYQNANNSVRVTDEFMNAVSAGAEVVTRNRRDGSVAGTFPAAKLWEEIVEAAHACGDPGLQFDDETNRWNTCPNEGRIRGSNPCQPEFATVLTPTGIKTFADLVEHDKIWSGKRWTRVVRKVATGVKPVYRYATRAGVFVGTADHRVISNGERVGAGLADSIDICPGEFYEDSDDFDPRIVMDGLVIGDGSRKICNGGRGRYVLLRVGEKDHEYLESEVADLMGTPWTGGDYRVRTSVSIKELPRVWNRQIPDRFRFGDRRTRRSFLRGLFSANGSVPAKTRVTLKATSRRLVEETQEMLSSLGIRSYYTVNLEHEEDLERGIWKGRESYDLNVGVDRYRFRQLIGFVHTYKNQALDESCQNTNTRNWSKRSFEVRDVEFLGEYPVWDIEVEAEEHTYWTGGLLVSNCGEFVFFDDTACNLASLNLRKFQREEGTLCEGAYSSAVRTAILAQEILVGRSSYPTEKIKRNSLKFRPLGLGFTNLGAYLMYAGLPYDSKEGRAEAAQIAALTTGVAYLRSSAIAEVKGPFETWERNAIAMDTVLEKHSKAARAVADSKTLLGREVLDVWDKVITLPGRSFRNAQVTLLAPTGTISFMMDCDTTGVEPDLTLVKRKRLSGGGELVFENRTLGPTLERLGYRESERDGILSQLRENGTLLGSGIELKDLRIFDCAFPDAAGRRVSTSGHLEMLAALQPLLSGAISKTVNLPAEATVEDVSEVYREAWRLGLKSISVYRRGCKRAEPVAAAKPGNGSEKDLSDPDSWRTSLEVETPERIVRREKLPQEATARRLKFDVGGHEGYVHAGFHPDGRIGEIFVRMSKEGSTVGGLLDSWATMVSIALQHGVPWSVVAEKFRWTRFEPSGFTDLEGLGSVTSALDLIVRWVDLRFPGGVLGGEAVPIVARSVAEAVREEAERPRVEAIEDSGPPCPICGSLTVPSGRCHSCPTCGETTGCG